MSSTATTHSASHWGRAGRRLRRDPVAAVACAYLIIVVVMAVFAPLIAQHDPNFQYLSERLSGPSGTHWLGTDDLGRDTFARLLFGARVSLQTSVLVALLAVAIAVPIGLVAGYRSGLVDLAVMRVTDALLSVPPLVIALAVAGILGPGTRNAVIALTVVVVPGLVRLVRAQALAIREEGYVEASKAIGTRSNVILARRIFPHVLSSLLVQVSVVLGTILVVEASLSFLGLGQQLPHASWGAMLKSGFALIATDARLILVPAIAITLTTLAFNALGDGLRDALVSGGRELHRRVGDVLGTTSVVPGAQRDRQGSVPGERVQGVDDAVLSIRNLRVGFDSGSDVVEVLDGVNLEVHRGEILGLVGESGCGKTVTSQSILRLLPSPPARILAGEICFEGRDLLTLSPKGMRSVRGSEIAMIFQDPMASLNPAFTIGDQLIEAQRVHRKVSRSAARERAIELLDRVGISDPERRLEEYPHTLSGGMRQRALIAMALANDPKLLIADEPTTALDVTVQAQILELIRDLSRERGMSVVFVTHDLGVVQELCDRVAVMYAGQIVEQSTVEQLFDGPLHPYTRALLRSRPRLGARLDRLPSISGVVPSPDAMPEGCRFFARCDHREDACAAASIPTSEVAVGRIVRCVRHSVPVSTAAELNGTSNRAAPVAEAMGQS
ncbi:MAG TPA: dipeptide/oligopeptide/nickel ABC transporter permease/ATP-binding protein [Acidimicrobiales bacterium]|nr:dipeptide/oligopeptide/nickel ABC transporter permease/ATP-binding protein [Acidimicrobiales bacterium]